MVSEGDAGMTKEINYIMAIDPSTTKVGWCCVTLDGEHFSSGHSDLERLASGELRCPPWTAETTPVPDEDEKGAAWDRIWSLALDLERMFRPVEIEGVARQIVVVAVEEPVGFHKNLDTERKMGASMGVVYAEAARRGVGVIRINPSQVKATGYSKKNAQSMRDAALFAGKDKVSEDEADAIGVAMAAVRKLREREWRLHRG